MLNTIQRIIMRHHWQKQIEAEKRLADLCQQRGKEVAVLYGQRGTRHDILAEVEQFLDGSH